MNKQQKSEEMELFNINEAFRNFYKIEEKNNCNI